MLQAMTGFATKYVIKFFHPIIVRRTVFVFMLGMREIVRTTSFSCWPSCVKNV